MRNSMRYTKMKGRKYRKSKKKTNKTRKYIKKYKAGCDKCANSGSSYHSDGKWTSGQLGGDQQNQDQMNYKLDPTPFSVN